jgi:hypothetical protein
VAGVRGGDSGGGGGDPPDAASDARRSKYVVLQDTINMLKVLEETVLEQGAELRNLRRLVGVTMPPPPPGVAGDVVGGAGVVGGARGMFFGPPGGGGGPGSGDPGPVGAMPPFGMGGGGR